MNTKQHIHALRSELLAMSRLSQRAVDYSLKAYELGKPEFSLHVRAAEHEVSNLHRSIADRGRALLAAGTPCDTDSRFAIPALRICRSLQIAYIAAAEIAQATMLGLEGGRGNVSLAIEEIGRLANRMFRLSVVALFNEEIHHAKAVLQNVEMEQSIELDVNRAHDCPIQRTDLQARLELTIKNNLVQIAKQAREIAFWLDLEDRTNITISRAGRVPSEFQFGTARKQSVCSRSEHSDRFSFG